MARYKFDQIAHYLNEKRMPSEADRETYIGLEHLDSGSLTVTRWGSDVDIKGQKLVMHKGDILFGRRNTYLKRAAIAPHDGLFSAHGMIWRPKEDVVDAGFFPFFVSSDYFMDEAIRISVGSLSPTINWRDLKELEFDLPDIDTQRKLSTLLWAMERAKTAYKNLIARTDELVKSQFVEMFGLPGTDTFGWGLVSLGSVCLINPKKSQDSRLVANLSVSFVSMPAVTEHGEIDATEKRKYDEVKTGFTYFAENDVLFAKITPCMENGKGAVARGLHNGIGFGSTEFHVLRPLKGVSDPQWIYTLTIFPQFRYDAANNMTGSAGQRRVPASFLESYRVAVPPIDLQEQFAAFVTQADKSKFAAQQALADLTATQKALMRQYLG